MSAREWQGIVQSLLSGVDDPTIRIEVARTINYLRIAYMHGAPEDQILNDLYEVCLTVIRLTKPELTDEQAKEKAMEFAQRLLDSFKLGSLLKRTMPRFSV